MLQIASNLLLALAVGGVAALLLMLLVFGLVNARIRAGIKRAAA